MALDRGANWLGIGIYTATEASHLLTLPAATVRRWLRGYRSAGGEYPPFWAPQLPKLEASWT